jgi:hypothetical protein
MITNHLPLKISGMPLTVTSLQPMPATHSHTSHIFISNFIANIFSKALISLFGDFYSPLKNPFIQ